MAKRKKTTAEGISMAAEAAAEADVSYKSVIEPFLADLPEKHAQFVRNHVSGQSQGRAYQGAYPYCGSVYSPTSCKNLTLNVRKL